MRQASPEGVTALHYNQVNLQKSTLKSNTAFIFKSAHLIEYNEKGAILQNRKANMDRYKFHL